MRLPELWSFSTHTIDTALLSMTTETAPPRRRLSIWARIWLSVAAGLFLLVSLVAYRIWRLTDPEEQVTISPETTILTAPLTPDGRYVNFVAALNEEMSRGVTPENNAAVVYLEAYGAGVLDPDVNLDPDVQKMFFERLGVPIPPPATLQTVDSMPFFEAYFDDEDVDSTLLAGRYVEETMETSQRPWSADEFPAMAAWIDACADSLDVVVQGSQRPEYWMPLVPYTGVGSLDTCQLPARTILRSCHYPLAARAMLKTERGELASAWDDLFAVLKFARSEDQSGLRMTQRRIRMFEAMVWDPMWRLSVHPDMTGEFAQICLSDLRQLPPLMSHVVVFDRFGRYAAVDELQRMPDGLSWLGWTILADEQYDSPRSRALLNAAIDWNESLRHAQRLLDEYVDALSEPIASDRYSRLDALDAEYKALRLEEQQATSILAESMLGGRRDLSRRAAATIVSYSAGPSSDASGYDMHATRADLLILAFALAAYRAERGGYPQALRDLVPSYIDDVQIDRFSAKPIIYHRTDDGGYIAYSIGLNLIDDGGVQGLRGREGDLVITSDPDD